jgi:hypothetical protein
MSDLALDTRVLNNPAGHAVLDPAHIGDIEGALGTIYQGDIRQRITWKAWFGTLMAIIGPGLIVMVGDNDAGAFSTYGQAGQNYGTALLWTLLLLVPVLYVNQEMVLRLGAVTGVGHARLILERFGKFWGAFSVIDLFILNGLTIVTEFIGSNLALSYLGVPRVWGIVVAAGIVIAAASTGSFRRFERFSLALCFFSLLLVPIFLMAHPPLAVIGHDLVVPRFPSAGNLSDFMLLVIAIVGTTIAPWQLFFQQSYDRQAHHATLHGLREGGPGDRHRRGAGRCDCHHGVHRGGLSGHRRLRPVHRCRRPRQGPGNLCRPHGRRDVRAGAGGRQHHRRIRRVAVHGLCDR